jgi:peroxiredoxin
VRGLGGEILAISADSVLSHRKLAAQLHVPFALASDSALEAAQAYGVVSEEDARRSRRALFVVEQDGTISYVADPFSPNSLAQLEGALRVMGLEL